MNNLIKFIYKIQYIFRNNSERQCKLINNLTNGDMAIWLYYNYIYIYISVFVFVFIKKIKYFKFNFKKEIFIQISLGGSYRVYEL